MPRFILIEPSIEDWSGHHYEYAARLLRAAKTLGFEPIAAVNRVFIDKHNPDIRFMPVYRMGKRLVSNNIPFYYFARKIKNKIRSLRLAKDVSVVSEVSSRSLIKRLFGWRKSHAFASDTRRLFETLKLKHDDLIFMPTVSEYEVRGLVTYFKKNITVSSAWHLLFHSNIVVQNPQGEWIACENREKLRKAFLALAPVIANKSVFFYTDTKELTDQYNDLKIFSFKTLPIPVDQSLHQEKVCKKSKPIRISYVGDARAEKGYHYLPQLINDLWAEVVAGKIEFVIQSNFNIEEGEPQAIIARALLEKFSREHVTLLRDSLSPTAYRNLILESDIILCLYDVRAYGARSSGIFAEALVAGIPVVVPEGSWMAGQLAGMKDEVALTYQDPMFLATCVRNIILQYDAYLETVGYFSKQWGAYHNPMSLLAALEVSSKAN